MYQNVLLQYLQAKHQSTLQNPHNKKKKKKESKSGTQHVHTLQPKLIYFLYQNLKAAKYKIA